MFMFRRVSKVLERSIEPSHDFREASDRNWEDRSELDTVQETVTFSNGTLKEKSGKREWDVSFDFQEKILSPGRHKGMVT